MFKCYTEVARSLVVQLLLRVTPITITLTPTRYHHNYSSPTTTLTIISLTTSFTTSFTTSLTIHYHSTHYHIPMHWAVQMEETNPTAG